MAYKKSYKYRYLKVALTPAMFEEVTGWAEKAALPWGQFGGLCVQLGLKAFIRSYSPESLLSPADWVNVMKAAGVTGDEVKSEKLE